MANYHDHKATGLGWWLTASLVLFAFGGSLGLSEGSLLLAVAIGLAATLLGAGFPDIDLSSSIPHRRLRLVLFSSSALLAAYALAQPAPQRALAAALAELALPTARGAAVALLTLILALALGSVAVALLTFFLPPHRGLTHRWPAAVTVALALAGLTGLGMRAVAAPDANLLASASAGFFLLGFASHLYKDGLLLRRPKRR